MFIRRAFDVFLAVQSDAAPSAPVTDWTLDWRWFATDGDDPTLPSERSLIDWPAWARPKTPRRG